MLATLRGVEAVGLGGSRAIQTADEGSDWDLGVYYRGGIDLAPLARYGEVHPPGSWGRIMNGGAWLSLGGTKVDVLLRDLDVALHWTEQARRGAYEVDALLGYIAGIPTYSLTAELAVNRIISGCLPPVEEYPAALSEAGVRRWTFHADFTLNHARMRAARGDVTGAVGQAAKAVMEGARAGVPSRTVGHQREDAHRARGAARRPRPVRLRPVVLTRAARVGGRDPCRARRGAIVSLAKDPRKEICACPWQ